MDNVMLYIIVDTFLGIVIIQAFSNSIMLLTLRKLPSRWILLVSMNSNILRLSISQNLIFDTINNNKIII